MTRRRSRRGGGDAGFTLVELTVVMLLMGVGMAIAVGAWNKYNAAQQQVGTTRALAGFLRETGARAVRDAVPYRVVFAPDGRSATAERCPTTSSCTTVTTTRPQGAVTYSGPSFTDRTGLTATTAWFYPRGTASKGSVSVTETGRTATHSVSVEGLTGRVTYQ